MNLALIASLSPVVDLVNLTSFILLVRLLCYNRSISLNLHVIGILGNGVTSAQKLALHTYKPLFDPEAYESYFSYRRAGHLVVEYSSFRGFARNASWRRFES